MNLLLLSFAKPVMIAGFFAGFLSFRSAVAIDEPAFEAQKLPAAQDAAIEEAAAPPRPEPKREAVPLEPEEAPER